MTLVGTAEVLVVANTSAFKKQLEDSTAPAFAGMREDAEAAGQDAGMALRTGVKDEAGKLERDLAGVGQASGASLREGVGKGAGGLETDLADLGSLSGSNLRRGVTEETGKLADDVAKDGEKAGEDLHKGLSGGLSKIASLIGATGLPLEHFKEGFEKAGEAAEESGHKVGGLGSTLGHVATIASVGVAAAFGGMALEGVHLAEGMQQADAAIASASDTSVAAATKIGNAMLGTEFTSEFTGQKLAAAYAGVAGQLKATEGHALDTAQAMQVMSAADDLTTAKQAALGATTATVAGILQAFQLKTADSAHVADVLYTASTATGQSVDALGSSLEKVRSKLGPTAGSVGDLSALLVDMTDRGITGRAALAALNGGMNTLEKTANGVQTAVSNQKAAYDQMNPALRQLADAYTAGTMTTSEFTKATDALPPQQAALAKQFATASAAVQTAQLKYKELGVTVFNAQGNFVGMGSIIDQLHPKFADMTQQEQFNAASTLFGAGAARQMMEVIDAGPAAYDKASASVNKMGAAHDAAAKQSHTLHVEEETLEAGLSDLATRIGEVLIPIITTMVAWFTKATAFVTDHKAALIALAVVVGGVLTTAIAVFTVNKMAAFAESFTTASGNVQKFAGNVQSAVKSVIGAFGEQTAAAEAASTAIEENAGKSATSTSTAAATIESENTAAGASFTGVATKASAAAATLGTDVAGEATAVTAADTTIEGENAAAGLSFTGLIGKIAPLAGALGTAYALIKGSQALGNNYTASQNPSLNAPDAKGINPTVSGTATGHVGGYSGPLQLLHDAGTLVSSIGHLFSGNAEFGHAKLTASTDKLTTSVDKNTATLTNFQTGKTTQLHTGVKSTGKGLERNAEDSYAPASVTQWAKEAQIAAAQTGIPASLLLADIDQESGGNPLAVSNKGAFGLTQFMPGTARSYGVQPGASAAATQSQITGQAEYLKALGGATNPTAALEGYYTGTPGDSVGASYAAQVLGGQHLYAAYDQAGSSTSAAAAGSAPTSPAVSAAVKLADARSKLTVTIAEETKAVNQQIVAIKASVAGTEETTVSAKGVVSQKHVPASTDAVTKANAEIASLKGALAVEVAQQRGALADQTAAQKAEQKQQSTDLKAGTAQLNKLLTAIHTGSLKSLATSLFDAHLAGLSTIEHDLDHDHSTALASLSKQLVEVHTKAMADLVKQEAAAAAAAAAKTAAANATAAAKLLSKESTDLTDTAKKHADLIAAQTKVYLDQQAETGLTGAALTAAQAQTALDQVTQASDQAIDTAQQAVDDAATGSALVQAQAANQLAQAQATATINEAMAQSTLDKANAAANTAASSSTTTPTTSTTTTTNAPTINLVFNAAGMTASQVMTELTFAVTTGALPIAPPPVLAAA